MVNRTSVMSMDSVSSKLHRNTMMIVPRFLGMTIFLRLLSVLFMFPSTILCGKNKQTWTINVLRHSFRNTILRQLAPQLHIPYFITFQPEDIPIVPTTFGTM